MSPSLVICRNLVVCDEVADIADNLIVLSKGVVKHDNNNNNNNNNNFFFIKNNTFIDSHSENTMDR